MGSDLHLQMLRTNENYRENMAFFNRFPNRLRATWELGIHVSCAASYYFEVAHQRVVPEALGGDWGSAVRPWRHDFQVVALSKAI